MSDGKLVIVSTDDQPLTIDINQLMEMFVADDQLYNQRLSSCRQCQARDPQLDTCTATGFLIPSLAKNKQSQCPLLIW